MSLIFTQNFSVTPETFGTTLVITSELLENGPTTNAMVALPNIGGALCSVPQSLADAHYLTAVQ